MKMNLGELKEIKIQIKDKGGPQFERARVSWIFEYGEIRGGRITLSVKNPNKLWVQFPSYRAKNSKYVHIIRINDNNLEKYLEEETLKKYESELNQEDNEVDFDDVLKDLK